MIFKKNGSDLFSLECFGRDDDSGHWGNWAFSCKAHDWVQGYTGIYLISFGSGENKKVIYVGMYAGNGRSLTNSDVIEQRWRKHLRTLTLLDSATKWSSVKLFNKLKAKALNAGYADFPLFQQKWLSENQSSFLKPNNCNTSWNRMSFAIQNWRELLELANEGLLLDSFAFHFVCLHADDHELSKNEIERVLRYFEKQVIEKLGRNLPANSQYKSKLTHTYFHYSPYNLEEDGSDSFKSLVEQVENDLKYSFVRTES